MVRIVGRPRKINNSRRFGEITDKEGKRFWKRKHGQKSCVLLQDQFGVEVGLVGVLVSSGVNVYSVV